MKGNVKEKIYHGISLFCIVLCIWLIGQVAADELLGAGEPQADHRPPVRTVETTPDAAAPEGFVLTEADIEAEVGKYLPEELPLEELRFSIGADGSIGMHTAVEKKKLLAYFETLGMEVPGGELATVMAPKTMEMDMQVLCSVDPESGMAQLTPGELRLAGNVLSPQVMPQTFWDGLSHALNKLLLASGVRFTDLQFTEGALCLK